MVGTLASPVLQGAVATESLVSGVFVFLVSLLVGTVAITLGAQALLDRDTGFRRAAITALLGALVYALVGVFFGWIPLLGPVLMLVAWVGVINWQYPGGWGTALGIAFVAWLVAVILLYGLGLLGIATDAFGIPGV
ncbi:hypothetical protein [Haloarcula sediminis]|uniref:hypothetical protein n=1 Tax=Haloarcula sediminis TaxID=3111777 RepID=UPI002D79357F|nr:hypothetical protein [Haloarcula sp. CK38]